MNVYEYLWTKLKMSIKLFAFLLMFSTFIFWQCKDLDKFTMFNMDFRESIIIQSSTGINLPFNVLTPDITTNSESTFASNKTRKDLVEDIRLKQLTLTITSPSSGDFRFLKSVVLYLNADGLPEVKIASKENIPSTQGNSLDLEVLDINLKEYIIKDKYTLRLNTVTDELISQDHQVEVYTQFRINAKLLGI